MASNEKSEGPLPEAIRRRQRQLGFGSIKEMAEAFELSPSSLAHWASGRKMPNLRFRKILAQDVGVDMPEELLGGEARSLFEPSASLPAETESGTSTPEAVRQEDFRSQRDGMDDLRAVVHGEELGAPIADRETFLPIYGFVRLTSDEVEVVDHAALQRLGMVYQLGQTYLVYRGATHTRLEHTLGVLHVLQEMATAVQTNHRSIVARGDDTKGLGEPLTPRETTFARLAALVHDIGHLPMGHTLEDELGLLDKHDCQHRLRLVLERDTWFGEKTESLASVIRRRYSPHVAAGVDPVELLIQIVAKDPESDTADVDPSVRIGVCRDMVGNTICADLLDYLLRDWYHIGKVKYNETRLLQYMEIRRDPKGDDQFVISLGVKPKIRSDAVSAILGLLESRYDLAESVLFHRTKCAAAAMLERAIQEIHAAIRAKGRQRDRWTADLEEDLLDVGDEGAIRLLVKKAKEAGSTPASSILSNLRRRRLFKAVQTRFRSDLPDDAVGRLLDWYSNSPDAPAVRRNIAELIERDMGLRPGTVALYCPDKAMNAKIAKVKIYANGVVEQLDRSDSGEALTGGHLRAQLNRFANLWRISIFVDAEAWEALSPHMQVLFRSLLEELVFGRQPMGTTPQESAEALARQFATTPGSPFHDRAISEVVAYTDQTVAHYSTYPSGAPTVSAFFEDGT